MKQRVLGLVGCLLLACVWNGCSEKNAQGGDTQTNWMQVCSEDAECGALHCVCGHCTLDCANNDDCAATPVPSTCHRRDDAEGQALCAVAAEPEDAGKPSAGI